MGSIIVATLKGIVIKLASKAFLEWLLFWAAEMIVASTKTDKDDQFLAKIKELHEQG